MPLLVLLLVALGIATAVAFVTWHYPTPMASPTPSLAAAKAVGRELGHHSRLRRTITSRLNPRVATGLALTVALGVVAVGGFVIGTLAYLVHTNSRLVESRCQRRPVGRRSCGARVRALADPHHATRRDVARRRPGLSGRCCRLPATTHRWIPVFLLAVLVGQWLLANGIKELLDRVRPTLNPITATLGPSFPSGHATAAAAFYAAAALVLGRGVGKHGRALLAGAAAGIAVAVACTRIFLDVHWLTDTGAGLFLGWGWFAVCCIAFGGRRFLRLGAAAEEAMHEADVERRRVLAEGSG